MVKMLEVRLVVVVAVLVLVLLVVSAFLSSSVEGQTISYGALSPDRVPKQKSPPLPTNPYHRGCLPEEQCRKGGSRPPAIEILEVASYEALRPALLRVHLYPT
ncbi:hypothetical protein Pfo_022263 [Paulownia fortunei]|nr:hypothetical protein Pfo_022263 [Paulownia fortunei]